MGYSAHECTHCLVFCTQKSLCDADTVRRKRTIWDVNGSQQNGNQGTLGGGGLGEWGRQEALERKRPPEGLRVHAGVTQRQGTQNVGVVPPWWSTACSWVHMQAHRRGQWLAQFCSRCGSTLELGEGTSFLTALWANGLWPQGWLPRPTGALGHPGLAVWVWGLGPQGGSRAQAVGL